MPLTVHDPCLLKMSLNRVWRCWKMKVDFSFDDNTKRDSEGLWALINRLVLVSRRCGVFRWCVGLGLIGTRFQPSGMEASSHAQRSRLMS